MIVVIDTNVLLVSISSKSKYYWLYKAITDKKIQVAFTTEILTEYEEQISLHWHAEVALNVIRSLIELSTSLPTHIYFRLNLIESDHEDNKFVDCAFAANADYIVTNDSDFNILKKTSFPSLEVTNITEFYEVLLKKGLI